MSRITLDERLFADSKWLKFSQLVGDRQLALGILVEVGWWILRQRKCTGTDMITVPGTRQDLTGILGEEKTDWLEQSRYLLEIEGRPVFVGFQSIVDGNRDGRAKESAKKAAYRKALKKRQSKGRSKDKKQSSGLSLDVSSGLSLDVSSGLSLDVSSGLSLDVSSGLSLDNNRSPDMSNGPSTGPSRKCPGTNGANHDSDGSCDDGCDSAPSRAPACAPACAPAQIFSSSSSLSSLKSKAQGRVKGDARGKRETNEISLDGFPESFAKETWPAFVAARLAARAKLTPNASQLVLSKARRWLTAFGPDSLEKKFQTAIERGWRGVFFDEDLAELRSAEEAAARQANPAIAEDAEEVARQWRQADSLARAKAESERRRRVAEAEARCSAEAQIQWEKQRFRDRQVVSETSEPSV